MQLTFFRVNEHTFVFYRKGGVWLDAGFPVTYIDLLREADAVYSHRDWGGWRKMKLPAEQEQICRERMRGIH